MSKEQVLRKEKEMIDQAFERLLKDYMSSPHGKKEDVIRKAYQFAYNAHYGIRRRSGEPYILHPIAVAHIACKDIGLGSTSICAALLHDVVEDTDYTVEDISNLFGEKVAQIVSGLTKISGGVFGEQASAQAENFRKLIVTMSTDIRVVLIKIADRLHNMRTLESQPVNKQYKIAGETEYIYAPLAHRLGLFTIKTELEDLSFKYNYPEKYQFISEKLSSERAKRMDQYDRFSLPIMNRLLAMGFEFKMKERFKSAYSIWNKMQAKHIPFEEVYDILGARIVFEPHPGSDERQECWRIYNLITQIYTPHPSRTRDWVTTPKSNGYEALHVTVMGPDGLWIEVQIRSKRMDDIAEKGLAAHWNYKKDYSSSESKIEEWLGTINDLLKHPDSDAMQFLDTFKLTLYDAEIFIFTPKGEMKTLPTGATALDFAFEIHSDIGKHCIGAKVNNKLVPLNYELQSGDQVEIITAKQQTPQPEWINYVTTIRAKRELTYLSKQANKLYHEKGERILNETFKSLGMKQQAKEDMISKTVLNSLLLHFSYKTLDDLLIGLGKNEVTITQLFAMAFNNGRTIADQETYQKLTAQEQDDNTETAITAGTQLPCPCCNAIPGDEVIGFKNPDGTVSIHLRNCEEALRLKSKYGPKITSVCWDAVPFQNFNAFIEVNGIDRKRMLLDIVQVISDRFDNNINHLDVSGVNGIFKAVINVSVKQANEVKNICDALSSIEGIDKVSRISHE
jgi:GTP pyrophosphokinase